MKLSVLHLARRHLMSESFTFLRTGKCKLRLWFLSCSVTLKEPSAYFSPLLIFPFFPRLTVSVSHPSSPSVLTLFHLKHTDTHTHTHTLPSLFSLPLLLLHDDGNCRPQVVGSGITALCLVGAADT